MENAHLTTAPVEHALLFKLEVHALPANVVHQPMHYSAPETEPALPLLLLELPVVQVEVFSFNANQVYSVSTVQLVLPLVLAQPPLEKMLHVLLSPPLVPTSGPAQSAHQPLLVRL